MTAGGTVAASVPDAACDASNAALTSVTVPSVFQVLLMTLAVKVALRAFGLQRILLWIRGRTAEERAAGSPSVDSLRAAEHAVAIAGALYPGRALCLEQSLVLYYVLRRQGFAVEYCQGVQPHPFKAHAWIEYAGEPLNDVAEHVNRFARLPISS